MVNLVGMVLGASPRGRAYKVAVTQWFGGEGDFGTHEPERMDGWPCTGCREVAMT
jgi:hypothetical protein